MTAVETRLELRGDGLDVRTSTTEDGILEITIRLEAGDDRGFVSLTGSPSELRSILARCLSTVNAVGRALAELEPDAD